jgi:nucleolar protein 15
MIFKNVITDFLQPANEEAALVVAKKSKTPKPTLEDTAKPKPASKEFIQKKSAKILRDDSLGKSGSLEKELKTAQSTKEFEEQGTIDHPGDAEAVVEDDDSEIDDQTEALLKGFESEGDEADVENEGGLEEGQEIPKVPDVSSKSKKQLQKTKEITKDKPGVVYVGRIPHGFYEHEMMEYFKQFGTILKLRLSRNRRSGASKHFAWIQFESAAVAEIVAKTMDNYLLFNHILKVKIVPDEQVPKNLWKGANKRFKRVPWNKIETRKVAQAKSEHAWEKLASREKERRAKKAEKLKAIGYDFDPPEIKSIKAIVRSVEQPALTNQDDPETKAIGAPETEAERRNKLDEEKRKDAADKEAKRAAELSEFAAASRTGAAAESGEEVSKIEDLKSDLIEASEATKKEKVKKSRKRNSSKTEA